MPGREAGIVLRAHGSRHFLPSAVTERIVSAPTVTRVPGDGTPLVAFGGRVLTALLLGDDGHAVLCVVDGETVALSGVAVERAGFFEPAEGGGITLEGERVPLLDLAPHLARVRHSGGLP